MILREVYVHTFGKLREKKINFSKGLTVILGKNETGKSTLFNVIDHLLFTPSKLTKRELEKKLDRWFPAAGGDVISAELDAQIENDGGTFQLYKQWGEVPESRLRINGEGSVTNEESLLEKIENVWGVSPETVRQVCLFPQNSLPETLPSLRESKGMVQSLSDVLQKSLIESEGISVAGFIDEVRERYTACFSRWDRDRNYPEKNKGIEDPWRTNVGTVLKAWYEMKRIEAEVREVEAFEKMLKTFRDSQKKLSEELGENENFLNQYEHVYTTAGERKGVEAELRDALGGEERTRNAKKRWDTILIELKDAKKLKEESVKKTTEYEEILAKRKQLREQYKRLEKFKIVKGLKSKADELYTKLRGYVNIPAEDYKKLRNAYAEMHDAELKLHSGELTGTIHALKNISFTFASGTGGAEKRDLIAGNSMTIDGAGKLNFTNEDLVIDVHTGADNYDALEAVFKRNRKQFSEICGTYGIKSLAEAEEIISKYKNLEEDAGTAKKVYWETLGNDSYEKLKEEVEAYGDLPKMDDVDEALENFGIWKERRETADKTIKRLERELRELSDTYGSEDELLNKFADYRGLKNKLEEKLDRIPGPPDSFGSVEEFVDTYREKQKIRERLQYELNELDKKIISTMKDMPDVPLPELEESLRIAEGTFTTALKEGETLKRILTTAEAIQREIKENPFLEFNRKAEEYLRRMASKQVRYGEAAEEVKASGKRSDEAPPFSGRIITEEGNALNFEQLSAGTKDIVALAVRLAMADYYLEDKKGFLLYDDPLIEMDPERQKAAADVIRKAAERFQSVLFTCHPGMCELFPGAAIIEIG